MTQPPRFGFPDPQGLDDPDEYIVSHTKLDAYDALVDAFFSLFDTAVPYLGAPETSSVLLSLAKGCVARHGRGDCHPLEQHILSVALADSGNDVRMAAEFARYWAPNLFPELVGDTDPGDTDPLEKRIRRLRNRRPNSRTKQRKNAPR
jgi:hypothetical protein